MPWPDFSEASFAFAFLREFEKYYTPSGYFPRAPDFITQNDEASKGYDVSAIIGSTPVFFQFKRSFILTNKNARELQLGHFVSTPVFRMHLHEKGDYRQHRALQKLEKINKYVYYVTSQEANLDDLSHNYTTNRIISNATKLFHPNKITLPNLTERHHVSFAKNISTSYIYSETGHKIESEIHNSREYFNGQFKFSTRKPTEQMITSRETDVTSQNFYEMIEKLTNAISADNMLLPGTLSQISDPVAKLSVAAYIKLDAHLTFAAPIGGSP